MAKHAKPDHILGNTTYDTMKYTTEIILPGIGALYFALAQIWGLPNAEEVVGSLAALTVFLGLLVGYSRKSYNHSDAKFDGEMVIEDNADGTGTMFSLDLSTPPEDMEQMHELKFRVNRG